MNKTYLEENALQVLYKNPLYSEIKETGIDRKIAILCAALDCCCASTFKIGDVTEEEDKLVTLSDLEEMYLEQIGYRKPNCPYYD